MRQKIIYVLSLIVAILLIVGLVIVRGTVVAKQEPIQEILNQIEANETELQQLQIRQAEINQSNAEAKRKLLEYGLKLSDPIDSGFDERQPGQLNEEGTAQEMPDVQGNDSHEKFKNLASKYGLDASQIRNVENHYGIKEGVILCITVAETSGGHKGAGGKNIGSVGSNDRGERPTYALMESGLEDIGRTLTNKYLGSKRTLGCLSNAGSCKESNDNGKRYATSTSSREKNMSSCLSTIYGTINPSEFSIRR